MKFLIQRVKKASVVADGVLTGHIGKGFLVLLGATDSDDTALCDKMIKKLMALRIFQDENGKTNLSVTDVGGELLIVSQFTLYADCRKGNRPSFINAGNPEHASMMYDYVCNKIKEDYNIDVQKGIFGADMEVELINDGPFTVMLDSDELFG